jgi:cellulose synthase/poly-beta-1,6-N-acetylglucosamine synthase-like glycosyltransferase
MLDLIFIPLLLVYFGVLVALFAYGLNFLHLTVIALRHGKTLPASSMPAEWPKIAVQLPIFNEMYVARRLINAVASFDYPLDKLEIQVLDDSTDETQAIIDKAVAYWRSRGVNLVLLRREDRTGFKAGALANGLDQTDAEYLALFDADFVPRPDFLKKALPVLHADAGLAFVQTRWGHTNRTQSLLTFLQSLSIDGHFSIEQYSRWRSGYFFNFNGTAGIWRRQALIDAGGWTSDTLTEDLDVSYRAFMRGWRAAYLRDVESPAELPMSFDAYRRQQDRWARGSLECAVKHIPNIWRSQYSWWQKLQATLHLTGYAIHLLMLSLTFLYPLLLVEATRYPTLMSLFSFMVLANLAGLAPLALFTSAQQQLGRRWERLVPLIFFMTILGTGMMLTTARAALRALLRRPSAFERTPKFGFRKRSADWMRLRYQRPVDLIVIAEIGLALFNLRTSLMALQVHAWSIALYTAIFGLGLCFTSGCTIAQGLTRRLKTPVLHEAASGTVLPSSIGAE